MLITGCNAAGQQLPTAILEMRQWVEEQVSERDLERQAKNEAKTNARAFDRVAKKIQGIEGAK